MCGYFFIGFIDFMLAGNKLTYSTNLFSLYDFKKNDDITFFSSKMNEINKINLSEQTKFRLSEITGIESYLKSGGQSKKILHKKLSKYVRAFDYIDKI